MNRLGVSLIIPAFNEEAYIGPTLDAISGALKHPDLPRDLHAEVVVVDNGSTDSTACIATSKGFCVIHEPRGNVAIARNAGADFAHGDLLVFVDADTHWPQLVMVRLLEAMNDVQCIGGAFDTEYRPQSVIIRGYLQLWRCFGRIFRMAQGATQFCSAKAFAAIGGYNEEIYMGEDVEFYSRLRRHAQSTGCFLKMIDDVRVVPSCRKFDKLPMWRTLLLTNPLTCLLLRRFKRPWGDWYNKPTR